MLNGTSLFVKYALLLQTLQLCVYTRSDNFLAMRIKRTILLALIVFTISACQSDTKRMEQFEVHGIDISHHQARIDWATIAQHDLDFVFVKATEGETHTDSLYQFNWNALKEAGIRRGAYHFFRPGTPALKQALNFIHSVKMEVGDLPPVVDVEVSDGIRDQTVITRLQTLIEILEAHYGIQPIIYTNQKFYSRYIENRLDTYPLWIARYGKSEPEVATPESWTFWQYGNRGQMEGIEGDVDFNVFRGSTEELKAMGLQEKAIYSYAR